MNDSRYRWILYIIIIVILGTITIQVYWNYKSYLTNKKQLINDVKVSLDNSVESYFANIAEENTITYSTNENFKNGVLTKNTKLDSIFHDLKKLKHLDSISVDITNDVAVFKHIINDSTIGIINSANKNKSWKAKEIFINQSKHFNLDSIPKDNIRDFKMLTSRVILSLVNDSIQLKTVDSLLQKEFQNKGLFLDYGLSFKSPISKAQYLYPDNIKAISLNAISNSTYLPHNSELKIHFNNITKTVLKRSFSGILLSILLVSAVISCLFYLLKIIKEQKQLSEIKNDFISNITHEFKTPIATIGVALESINDFNVIDDKEKTKKYLKMSNDQLSKLNIMVEKLLDTATLDSDSLKLSKEQYNITELLISMVEKHKMQTDKIIHFNSTAENIYASIDIFHFENAISNIIDNAIKYGGHNIMVTLEQNTIAFSIIISDDGTSLNKIHRDKIFEKFYRIPKGNTHDIKGFGIGLYYTKKIVEKHNGAIHLDLSKNLTTFKISLPNE